MRAMHNTQLASGNIQRYCGSEEKDSQFSAFVRGPVLWIS
jgi:hypothetical protein